MGEGGGGVTLCQSKGTHKILVSFSPPVVGFKKGLKGGITGTRAPLSYAAAFFSSLSQIPPVFAMYKEWLSVTFLTPDLDIIAAYFVGILVITYTSKLFQSSSYWVKASVETS